MSEIEHVVILTRQLESLLKKRYHAQGKGLHQLISSCETRLPHELILQLRYVATVRNRLLHEEGYTLDNPKQFYQQAKFCIKRLSPRSTRMMWEIALGVVLFITLGSLIFYYLNGEMIAQ